MNADNERVLSAFIRENPRQVFPPLLRLLDPALHCIRNLPRAGLDSFLDLSRCLILTLLRLDNFDCLHDDGK